MCLNTNLNDLCLVGPVNAPPTGLSFQNTDAVLPGKGIPKRHFPDNNIGQEGGITVISALCSVTRPTVLNKAFLGCNKQSQSYTFGSLCQAHCRMPENCPCLEEIWNSLISFHRPLSALKGTKVIVYGIPIFISWVHYPDGHSGKATVKNWSWVNWKLTPAMKQ